MFVCHRYANCTFCWWNYSLARTTYRQYEMRQKEEEKTCDTCKSISMNASQFMKVCVQLVHEGSMFANGTLAFATCISIHYKFRWCEHRAHHTRCSSYKWEAQMGKYTHRHTVLTYSKFYGIKVSSVITALLSDVIADEMIKSGCHWV